MKMNGQIRKPDGALSSAHNSFATNALGRTNQEPSKDLMETTGHGSIESGLH